MEECPSGKSCKSNASSRRRNRATKKNPYPVEECEEGGELIECSSKYCKSCTAGLIADCVAVCCCPCAVLNLLALAFVKLPYVVGKKCLGIEKRKCKKLEKKRKLGSGNDCAVERNERVEMEMEMESVSRGIGFDGEFDHGCAGFEAEKVWFELYQVGHLGFGRVSFTGIPSSKLRNSESNLSSCSFSS